MATVVKTPREEPRLGGRGPGSGSWSGGNGGGSGGREYHDSPEKYRIGIWIANAGILMVFMAFSSAFIVGRAKGHLIELPSALWFSTAVIIVSSVTIEVARQALRRGIESAFKQWMTITTALGVLFLAGQVEAFRQLAANGFYLSSNPHTSYAYVLTALHGLHLMGGLFALLYVMIRARWSWAAPRKRVTVDATAIYWHFLDGLWIYLFILLFFWR